MRLRTALVEIAVPPGQALLDAAAQRLAATAGAVLRWGLVRAAADSALLELAIVEGDDTGLAAHAVAGTAAPATGTHVALVVPTGVGAEVGGFIGDAGPWARVFESVADSVLVHPNVVNAADFYSGGERSVYVDGWTLDEFFAGRLRLAPGRAPRVGLVLDDLDPALSARLLNAANAMSTAGGVELVAYARTAEKVKLSAEPSALGHYVGAVDNPEVLFAAAAAVQAAGAEAIAVVTAISGVREEDLLQHYAGHGPNPVGAMEALISRAVTWRTGLPCAHAPAFVDGLGEASGRIVDPRAAAEVASGTGLPCVLQGMRRLPRAVSSGGLGVADLAAIVVPYGCAGGAPALAARDFGVPLVAVRANRCTVGVDADRLGLPGAVVVADYAEAVAYVAAVRARVSWPALRAPTRRLPPARASSA
jgi:Protein of unknown function (DUF3326)